MRLGKAERTLRLYSQGLASVLSSTALPYGYTLTIWSTGELVRRAHRPPTVTEIFLFVAGAVTSYGVLRTVVGAERRRGSEFGRLRTIRTGAIHAVAIGGAAVLADLLARAPAVAAWALAPFVSTLAYLTIVAVEEALEVRERGPTRRPELPPSNA